MLLMTRSKHALKNVAMQVAAMSPKYVSREEVSQEYLDHEKEILLAQAKKREPGETGKHHREDDHRTSEQRAQRDLSA